MSASRPPRIAMIGLGQWGPNLLRNLREAGAEVAVLCDANPARLEEFRPLHPGARLTTSIDEALSADAEASVFLIPNLPAQR